MKTFGFELFLLLMEARFIFSSQYCSSLDVCPPDDDVSMHNSISTPLRRHLQQNCFCDKFCDIMGDCCSEHNAFNNIDGHDAKSRMGSRSIKKHLHCSPIQSVSGIKYVSDERFKTYLKDLYMVSSCPDDYDNDVVVQKCLNRSKTDNQFSEDNDHMHEWPVTSNYTGIWYRNVFCAACWKDYDVMFWQAATHCNPKDTTPEDNVAVDFLAYDGTTGAMDERIPPVCNEDKFMFLSPTGFHNLRSCVEPSVVTKCSDSWTDTTVQTHCESGPTTGLLKHRPLVYDRDNTPYSNIDCYRCNYGDMNDVRCQRNLTNYIEHNYDDFLAGMFPITVLFDPKSPSRSRNRGAGRSCPTGAVYDAFTKSCKKIFCPNSNILLDEGTCPHTTLDNCTQVNINQSDFVLVQGNATLTHYNTVLTPDQYVIMENRSNILMTCVKFLRTGLGELREQKIDIATLVSVVSQLLSIVCLILNLIVYSLLPKLRNTPGKTLMSLVVSLLLAQVVFLVGAGRTEYKEVCFAIAVVIHYSTLAAFFWMNALAIDLAMTFSPDMRQRSRNSIRRRFIYFSMYGWLGPLLIIITSILLEVFRRSTSPFNPNYAGENICWLSNIEGLILLFLVPIAFLLTANIILYIYTTTNIIKASQVGAEARERNTTKLAIYIKLSFIMGIAWIFAFLWMLTQNEIVRYIFIVANGLQGLFLFLSFVCRKRVYHQFLVKCGRRQEKDVSKPTNSMSSNYNTNRVTEDTRVTSNRNTTAI